MLIDARTIDRGAVVRTDVAVVGAGVCGMTLGLAFAGAPFSTCLIESGGLKPDKKTQSLYWGENAGLPYYPLDTARARFFGGTTHFWKIKLPDSGMAARVQPMDAIDFQTRDWIPHSGWPFDREHLVPYYERAHEICGIGPFNYDPDFWTGSAGPPLPLNSDRVRTTIFQFVDRKVFHDRHTRHIKNADTIKTLLHANVTGIQTDETGSQVAGLKVSCLDGNQFVVKAKVYVLALGGLETPRLLLNSDEVHRSGLGNAHDLVGRFFMEHPHLWSGCFVPASRQVGTATGLYQLHRKDGVAIMAKLALSEKTLRSERLANHCFSIHPDYKLTHDHYISGGSAAVDSFRRFKAHLDKRRLPPDALKLLGRTIAGAGAIARAAGRKLSGSFEKESVQAKVVPVYRLNHMSEQVPNPDSRVRLSDDTDALGMRRIALDWKLCEQDAYTITRAQEIISAELQAAGLGCLKIDTHRDAIPHTVHGGWHHMGTTRMHDDPRRGVVDRNCRVHGVSNLFIAGASVFPTGGVANPVLTTMALVLRLADHVQKTMETA